MPPYRFQPPCFECLEIIARPLLRLRGAGEDHHVAAGVNILDQPFAAPVYDVGKPSIS
jgi:hypothetical protein